MIPENRKPQPRTELLEKIASKLYERIDSSFNYIIPNGYYTSTNFDVESGESDITDRAKNTTQLSIDEVLAVMQIFKERGYFPYKSYSRKGTPIYYVRRRKPSYEDIIHL